MLLRQSDGMMYHVFFACVRFLHEDFTFWQPLRAKSLYLCGMDRDAGGVWQNISDGGKDKAALSCFCLLLACELLSNFQ